MKTWKKCVLATAGILLFLPALINRAIFFIANQKDTDKNTDYFYKSKFGNIHYTIHGNGRPLILLHETNIGFSAKEWDNNIEFLSGYYKVYCIDLPGYGKSEKQPITYTAYLYASFINDFISNVIKRPVSAIGNGTSCIFMMMAYELNAKNFKKFILIEPLGITSGLPTKQDKKLLSLLNLPLLGTSIYTFLSSYSSIKKYLYTQAFFSKECISKELIDTLYFSAHKGGIVSRYSTASFLSHFMNTDIKTVLKELKLPFMVVWGENSIHNPIENMEILEEIRPDINYCIFEKTRALPHYENSTEFNKVCREFFN